MYTAAPVIRPICSARVCADLFSSLGVASIATRIRLYMALPLVLHRSGRPGRHVASRSLQRRFDGSRMQLERASSSRHKQRQQYTKHADPRENIKDGVEGHPRTDQETAEQWPSNAT